MDNGFDLFGLPVDPATGKPGRPRKEATTEDRNRIKMLLAVGWSVERMASVVRMSMPTFRRVFFLELKERHMMRDRLYARRLEIAATEADKGNIAALKELGKMLEQQDRFFAEAEMKAAQDRGQSPEPMGKKELAAAVAREAEQSDGWGTDLSFSGRGNRH